MPDKNPSRSQIELAAQCVGYRSGGVRYGNRAVFLFSGIPLGGARLLEIGCGSGAWAVWAGLHGAAKVVGIEPEAEGSTAGSSSTFSRAVEALGLTDRVEMKVCTLQELPAPDTPYDVVMMYNVINHLDEGAVEVLHKDDAAFRRYVDILERLRSMIRPGGWVVVTDCGRSNFWNALGMRSPFMRTIEWHKHQNPSLWAKAFERAGYRKADLRWTPLHPLGRLAANRVVQYLTCSHFCLRFRAGGAGE